MSVYDNRRYRRGRRRPPARAWGWLVFVVILMAGAFFLGGLMLAPYLLAQSDRERGVSAPPAGETAPPVPERSVEMPPEILLAPAPAAPAGREPDRGESPQPPQKPRAETEERDAETPSPARKREVRETARPAATTPSEMPPRLQRPEAPPDGDAPDLRGPWEGRHTGRRASLVVTRQDGRAFEGVMAVRTGGRTVEVTVQGEIEPDTGAVVLRETRVRGGARARVWDLGTNRGRLEGGDQMEGSGMDSAGRSYTWSFSR